MGQKEAEKIIAILGESGAEFSKLVHEPVFTSEQAAKTRGTPLSEGVKAMVLKSNSGKFFLFCLPADKRIDLKKAAETAGERVFLASAEEALGATGCEIGSVSPFCGRLSGMPAFFDIGIRKNEEVEFNIGLHTHSVRMKSAELEKMLGAMEAEFLK